MKRSLLVLGLPLFLLSHLNTFAQAVNDTCSGAISLTVGSTCINTLVVKDGSVFNSSVPDPGCATYVGADLWYKLVMPATGAVRVETDVSDGSITDGGMAIYTGADCNNLTLLECNDDGNSSSSERFERITVQQPAGTTIYIRVWERNGVGAGSFNLCAFEITIPPDATNDDCIDAIELTVSTTCTPIVGTNYGATPSENADATIPDPGCASYAGDDVWFKLTVPASGNLEVQTYEDDLFITDGGLAIYSGTCNPNGLTLLVCNDDGGNISTITPGFERIQLLDQTPGETLFVRVWSFNNNEFGTFNICATEVTLPPPATNDDCIDAIELTIGATCTPTLGTNSGATNSEDFDATIPDPGCYYSGGDVWFKVVVPVSGDLEIETYEDDLSISDGGMAVYSGTCDPNGLTLLACDDNNGLISIYGFERIQLLNQIPGETLFVRVWSYNNVIGTFNICASETTPPPPPVNDDCSGAIELIVADYCSIATSTFVTNIGATPSENADPTIPDPGCAGYAGGDIWYKTVVPPSGNLEVETWVDDFTVTDGGMAIYSGSCNSNGLTLLSCANDNGTVSNNFERIEVVGQTPGETLYIRIWSYNNIEVGTFTICVSELPPPNDECIDAIELIVGTTCTPVIGSNFKGSYSTSFDPTIPDPNCGFLNSTAADVWFKVVVPPSGDLTVETYDYPSSVVTEGSIAVYSGTCDPNGLTLLDCDTDSSIINSNFGKINLLGQTPGETLYVRFWSKFNPQTTGKGPFNICAYEIAPITNDDCFEAIELTVGTTCNAIIGTNLGATASEVADSSIPDPGCGVYNGGDVWFKLTVPASGNFAVETYEDDLSLTNTAIAIYSGNCSPNGLTLLACDNSGGIITNETYFGRIVMFNQTPGEILYIRAWSNNNTELGTFNICAYEITPTVNDNCVDAIELTIGTTCNAIIGTNVNATASEVVDPTIPNPVCGFYYGSDVWFKVTVPASGNFAVETYEDDNSIADGGIAIYSGNCGPNGLTLLVCDYDNSQISNKDFGRIAMFDQTPGETLYVRFWNFFNADFGTFNICAYEITPTVNDNCVDAIELNVGTTCNAIIVTNVNSTTSEDADPTIPDPGCAGYTGFDIWYKTIVPPSGDFAVETYKDDNSITDGGMAIYSGNCNPNGLTLLACDNDSGTIDPFGSGFERIEMFGQTPGEILYVRVWASGNFAVKFGTFNICATELNPLSTQNVDLNTFSMNPNPAKDIVNINFNKALNENISIRVFDIQGKLVLRKREINRTTSLDISNLKSGMYFVELRNGQQLATKKLIVE